MYSNNEIGIITAAVNDVGNKLKYDTITRWGENE